MKDKEDNNERLRVMWAHVLRNMRGIWGFYSPQCLYLLEIHSWVAFLNPQSGRCMVAIRTRVGARALGRLGGRQVGLFSSEVCAGLWGLCEGSDCRRELSCDLRLGVEWRSEALDVPVLQGGGGRRSLKSETTSGYIMSSWSAWEK